MDFDIEQLLFDVTCLPCNADDHMLCWNPKIDKCCCFDKRQAAGEFENVTSEKSILGGYQKSPDAITDVTSTGRKRAAIMYPISEGMICEWAGLKFAGGGVIPVIGCYNNKATDIHHGPDKNTLNNTAANVHRICADDHNRWHAANNQFYGDRPAGTEPFIPIDEWFWTAHDSNTKATPEETVASITEGKWKSREARRIDNAGYSAAGDSQAESSSGGEANTGNAEAELSTTTADSSRT